MGVVIYGSFGQLWWEKRVRVFVWRCAPVFYALFTLVKIPVTSGWKSMANIFLAQPCAWRVVSLQVLGCGKTSYRKGVVMAGHREPVSWREQLRASLKQTADPDATIRFGVGMGVLFFVLNSFRDEVGLVLNLGLSLSLVAVFGIYGLAARNPGGRPRYVRGVVAAAVLIGVLAAALALVGQFF
ncbi:hypothetical protein CAQU_00205 [Corynebacterium aquilae DSM 44791]|uniref:Uncharacterized protein n=2 Tax=Corynebacterium aquilae TaxID=203263 RepID=A0A1L7CD48_9CORY|nr:hypothetical protein CAQU_00205 [Corynebacterium aquilae DSM 44791]